MKAPGTFSAWYRLGVIMDIRYTGKHMRVTEGMKSHLGEKIAKFEKYAPRLVESHVVLKKEKYFFVAEITLLAKNLRAYGDATSQDNVYAAIDQAYLRVEKQLKRFREKIKDHHKHAKAGHNGFKTKSKKAIREAEEKQV